MNKPALPGATGWAPIPGAIFPACTLPDWTAYEAGDDAQRYVIALTWARTMNDHTAVQALRDEAWDLFGRAFSERIDRYGPPEGFVFDRWQGRDLDKEDAIELDEDLDVTPTQSGSGA